MKYPLLFVIRLIQLTSFFLLLVFTSCHSQNTEGYDPNSEQNDSTTGEGEGLAGQFPGDEGINDHPAVLFASGFENGLEGWTKYNPNVSVIVDDKTIANSGSKSLQTTATKGMNTGGDAIFKFPETRDEIYLRFYTKLHKDSVIPHHFVKIRAFKPDPYWGNAGQRPKGDEAFWTGIEPSRNHTWQFYTYWYKMRRWQTYAGVPDTSRGPNPYYGNLFHPPDQEPFEREEWICVEAYMKANTPGKSDGEMAFWIDGKKISEWKPGTPTGTWRGEAAENIVYFDDVVIATEYIGPRSMK